MILLITEFRLKDRAGEEVVSAIREFVTGVHCEEPDTEYRAFRLRDSSDFLHIMAFTDEVAQKQHRTAGYTKKLLEVLYPNCEVEPEFTSLIPV